MFSKEFMRYLINYQPDGYNCSEKSESSIKEIEFKTRNNGSPLRVFVSINSK